MLRLASYRGYSKLHTPIYLPPVPTRSKEQWAPPLRPSTSTRLVSPPGLLGCLCAARYNGVDHLDDRIFD